MNKRILIFVLYLLLVLQLAASGQNVVIVVIDGARYSETLGAKSRYMSGIWNELRPRGTIWINFFNNGITVTKQGHASIITGTWQKIDYEGAVRPTCPTIFEYFGKAENGPERPTAIIVGKSKLDMLAYSTSTEYGDKYKARVSIGKNDTSVVNIFKEVLTLDRPGIVLINLPDVDNAGHSGNWKEYTSALRTADSLVCEIWHTLQADSVYRDNTTLLITNDHGRHDKKHGGFKKHGDKCEGCRHIMLLAVGQGIPVDKKVAEIHEQIDIAPTVGELLSFKTECVKGKSLLHDELLK